jgi:NADPH2:quinone reductase
MALYGAASGAVEPFDPIILAGKGSLFLTRPSLHHHTLTKEEFDERAKVFRR